MSRIGSSSSMFVRAQQRSRLLRLLRMLCVLTLLALPALCRAQYSFLPLHSFTRSDSDGNAPDAGLIQDSQGNFYGTASVGGPYGVGTVYELSPPTLGNPDWTLTVLHTFTFSSDGASPQGGLVMDSQGNLYGAAVAGGHDGFGFGTIYELSPPTAGQTDWTFTTLHIFAGTDGSVADCRLIIDSQGNLYGTAAYRNTGNAGTVYELSPPTAGQTDWTFTTLYNFINGSVGGHPYADRPWAGLIMDHQGNLYGTAVRDDDGEDDFGMVYKLSPPTGGNPAWTFTSLYSFTGGNDGSVPYAGVMMDSRGNLFGTTNKGGQNGFGTVYELSPSTGDDSAWTFATLHSFAGFLGEDGANPYASLIQDSQGNLFGTTFLGGQNGDVIVNGGGGGPPAGRGTVYELSPPTAGSPDWSFHLLYSFSSIGPSGAHPLAEVLMDSQGNLFGTTVAYGLGGGGTIYELMATVVVTPPVLTQLAPNSIKVPANKTTLTLHGSAFTNAAHVTFNGTPLATTFVSSTKLIALLPAALLQQDGTAQISVTQSGATSNSLPLTLVPTSRLSLATGKPTRDPATGNVLVPVTLTNTGLASTTGVTLTASSLNGAATLTSLPIGLGDLAAGGSASTTVVFASNVAPKGQKVSLKVKVTSDRGPQVLLGSVKIP